jgi:nitroimidazol reductase NimA-like FMN-containing flavoprotein (pyridoxamine 5'-phosphate oxidase superfamily)
MRKLRPEEIENFVQKSNWATIVTASPDGKPYAIEATYFIINNDTVGFMINPRGQTFINLAVNPQLLLKITIANKDLSYWAGVSLFGTGQKITEPEEIEHGWHLLGKIMKTDYSKALEKFKNAGAGSPFLRCLITERTGRCSGA